MFVFRVFHGTWDVKSPACKCLMVVCDQASLNEPVKSLVPKHHEFFVTEPQRYEGGWETKPSALITKFTRE